MILEVLLHQGYSWVPHTMGFLIIREDGNPLLKLINGGLNKRRESEIREKTGFTMFKETSAIILRVHYNEFS